MEYFKIVIPNYNNGEWIEKCINSILNQTFQDFHIVVVDDKSTDNSLEVIHKFIDNEEYYKKITVIPSEKKVWNGGARNIGIRTPIESKYTLFLDSDDWYEDESCLQTIYDTIQENYEPDCISLSYYCLVGENKWLQELERNTPEDLVKSLYVACWTKCVKTELIQEFPENTLMEDVVQHIKQCDAIESIVSIKKPLIVWNRNNTNSCSREENQDCQKGKWKSSMYRYAADLMDLELTKDYTKEHRAWREEVVLNNIKDGKYIQ